MVTWAVEPDVLLSRLPAHTELDRWHGQSFVTLLGLSFSDARVIGIPAFDHRAFPGVNFRFYVRRPMPSGEDRRGVVFIREIVPRRAIALLARLLYGEPFVALPARRRRDAERLVYEWRSTARWNRLAVEERGEPLLPVRGSLEEFVVERYWGYSRRSGNRAFEFRVEHPRWRLRAANVVDLECDVAGLYGPEFVEALRRRPAAAFVAAGSAVAVRAGGVVG